MRLAKEIVKDMALLERNSDMLPSGITLEDAQESIIDAKLEPVREALKGIVDSITEAEDCEDLLLFFQAFAEIRAAKAALAKLSEEE